MPATRARNEPVLTAASVTAAVGALIALLVAFGLDLSDGQTQAILGAVAVIAPLLVALSRQFVTPTRKRTRSKPRAGAQGAGGDARRKPSARGAPTL